MVENPVRRKFSRHIDVRCYFVRESVKAGFVKFIPLYTHKKVADALTKSLPSPAFIGHRRVVMGQTPVSSKFLHQFFGLFFFIHYSVTYFLDCPMCSIDAHIVHGGERHTTHGTLSLREFVSGLPRYRLPIRGVREQSVRGVREQYVVWARGKRRGATVRHLLSAAVHADITIFLPLF